VGPNGIVRGGDARLDLKSNFTRIQILSNFDRFKKGLAGLEKFEIKYRCGGFEDRNNFLYRNLFRFEKMKNRRSF
jgi:hypothetical protein